MTVLGPGQQRLGALSRPARHRPRPTPLRHTEPITWKPRSLVSRLPEKARDDLLGLGTEITFQGGETLIAEGDLTTDVFLLIRGWFKVVSSSESGREALMAIRSSGDLVGELATFDGQPRLTTVRAVGPSSARRIGERDFHLFLDRHSQAALAVTQTVAEKLRAATRRRLEFSTCSVATRLARVLLELAGAYGEPGPEGVRLDASLTQSDLAALVGAAAPTIHRALSQLRADGAITTGYRTILIPDLDRLRHHAQP
jgi:CRP/FNR family transcriptional regulator, cyclic AMP receptor protein